MPHGDILAAASGPAISSVGGGCRMGAFATGRAEPPGPTAQPAVPSEAKQDAKSLASGDALRSVVADTHAADVFRDGPINTASFIEKPLQPRGASSSPQLLVQVLVESNFGQKATLPVSGCDTIRELKMRLANKPWFTSKHCLFFGGKELLDHDMVADIVNQVNAAGNPNYLHVFVRAKDVRYGNISTSAASTSFGNLRALDAAEASASRSPPNDSFTPRVSHSNDDLALAAVSSSDAADLAPVLHIVIRKNSNVTWNSASRSGEFELTVRATDTADQLKQQLLPSSDDASSPALHSDINLFHNGVRLQADRPLLAYGLSDGDVLDIVPWEPAVRSAISAAVAASTIELQPGLSSPTHALYLSWQKAADGLRAGIVPELAPSGSGGSYFLRGPDHAVVAVFKPMDEEPNMRNNPRSLGQSPPSPPSPPGLALVPACVRRGVLPGEGAQREIAAYLLDHGHRAGVPATAPVFLTYPDGSTKHGSLQQYVHSDSDCEEMGYSAFAVQEVHKIAVLDLRLCNADRNGSNILARRVDGEWRLTPIDHGFCMPDTWTDMAFAWSSWRQANVPFDRDTVEYIMGLDAGGDLAMLAECGVRVRPACARIFKAATMVLKKVAARGLSPRDAADILERNTLRKSTMEKMHRVACEKALREEEDKELESTAAAGAVLTKSIRSSSAAMTPKSDVIYLKHLDQLLDEYLDDLPDDAIEFP